MSSPHKNNKQKRSKITGPETTIFILYELDGIPKRRFFFCSSTLNDISAHWTVVNGFNDCDHLLRLLFVLLLLLLEFSVKQTISGHLSH